MKRNTFNLPIILILALALLPVRYIARADAYIVDTVADENDGSCSDGDCSLRDAIILAYNTPGSDTINFAISGSGVHTITLNSVLPSLTSGGITIDGYSQSGASEATDTTSATLKIVIDGNKAFDDALYISSANNMIKGLVINSFLGGGIVIWGSNATSNTVSGNYIGTDASGAIALGNNSGVSIWSGAQNNTIGGDTPGERNLISGNGAGVAILGSGTTSNTVSGNYIGADANGANALGNTSSGVSISDGAQNNTVGGDTSGERNVISGNKNNGVGIEGSDTTGNVVSGNYIGTDASGTTALYNLNNGVYIGDGAHDNTIGGDTPGERNVISGNQYNGVSIGANTIGAYNNTVSGNYIGVDASGTTALGNIHNGVRIHSGAHNNTIGGDKPGERNVISGNSQKGVVIEGSGTMGNTVSGNYIGPNANNTANLVNQYGVYIWDGAQNNTIGGNAPGKGNVISGSYYDGVLVYGSSATGNTIAANSIHDNGSAGINLQDGGNTELAAPAITSVSATGASGTGCAWCTIHIYSDDEDEGETWHAPLVNTDASGGWTYSGAISGPFVTATNTDSSGNTSEFSTPKRVGPAVYIYLPLVLNSVEGLVARN